MPKIPTLIDKILMNAVSASMQGGGTGMFFRCEYHGMNRGLEPVEPRCAECQVISLWIKDAVATEANAALLPLPEAELVLRAVANACQTERENGTLNLHLYKRAPVRFDDEAEAHLQNAVVLTDS